MTIPAAEQEHVTGIVVLAAYDTLAEHLPALDALAMLSTIGASPRDLTAVVEQRPIALPILITRTGDH